MNRRTFITGTTTALALTPMLGRVSAQDTNPDARWDETSFLFGNAFDLLPQATEGEIEILSLIVSPEGSVFGMTSLYGLIHNNSNDAMVLVNLNTEDQTQYPMFDATQRIITPGAYALLTISLMADISADNDLPAFDPEFVKPEDVENTVGFYRATVPLQIDHAEVGFDMLTMGLTNTSETDIPDSFLGGIIMWFDETGTPITAWTLGELTSLATGASHEGENYLFVEFDPETPYLLGYYGYTD
ncbi:MAG: hypothetical protein M9934_06600 [Thermomicrobiales bacterium]|nr:hypothetical protein [Thermomicrobiales bacterium]MCO5227940.1 hypothetical protein [Thermomicrobiales bacterium]